MYDKEVLSDWLLSFPEFEKRFCKVVRHAVACALYPYGQTLGDIEKEEKAIVGVKWQQLFRREFGICKGTSTFDCACLILGNKIQFDCKLTVRDNWMIPPELSREEGLCLVCQYNEAASIRAGLVWAKEEYLTGQPGMGNRDKKRSLNQRGKAAIDWILKS